MDEFMESLTLIQTNKIHKFPVVLMGKEYWSGLLKWLEKDMAGNGYISPEDLDMFHVTDDPEEAVRVIKSFTINMKEMKLR